MSPDIKVTIAGLSPMMTSGGFGTGDTTKQYVKETDLTEEDLYEIFLGWE